MSDFKFQCGTFDENLSELLSLKDQAVARQFDAASCQTRYDYNRLDAAEYQFEEALEAFKSKWERAAKVGISVLKVQQS